MSRKRWHGMVKSVCIRCYKYLEEEKDVSELVDLIIKNKDLMQVAENISKLLAA